MYTLKKELGQHFLHDENMCKKIADATLLHQPVQLLEVGPGGGAITKYLYNIMGIDFKAVEIDNEKIDYLLHTYPELQGKIIAESFLDIGLPFETAFTVVGNFPYNISTQIMFKILEWGSSVEMVIGMFQKEVAQRIAAKEGSKTYGILSVLIQAKYKVDYLFDVNPGCFTPPPNVQSGVIRLTPLLSPVVVSSEKKFNLLVKTAFNQRRKMLRNSVKTLFDGEELQKNIFEKRPEQLNVAEFAALSFLMK